MRGNKFFPNFLTSDESEYGFNLTDLWFKHLLILYFSMFYNLTN